MLWSPVYVLVLIERFLIKVKERTANPIAVDFKKSLPLSGTRLFWAS